MKTVLKPSLDIINLKEVVSDAWSLFAWALFNVAPRKKKKIMSSTLKRPVSTTTFFRKTRFGQVNYVEGGSLKRILLLDGQLKHIHTLA